MVIAGVAQGRMNMDIARDLGVTPGRVVQIKRQILAVQTRAASKKEEITETET